ncbi:MAG: Gldg family protein, partial [Chloroflexota bacterium]
MADEQQNLNRERPTGASHAKAGHAGWLLRRGSLLAYLIVVLAVLVGVNVLASRHDRSWDLTKGKQNSLSNESVKVLEGLHQPLHLLYFDRSTNFASARAFLGRYQRVSRQVDVQFIDPDRHPDQARQYK